MTRPEKRVYEFGPFRLDTEQRVLLRDGDAVPLTPKAFDTLLVLVQNSGRVITKEELMLRVWPDTFVEEANLAVNISILRKTLGARGSRGYIETLPRRGYRFSAAVKETSDSGIGQDKTIRSNAAVEAQQKARQRESPAILPVSTARAEARSDESIPLPETKYAKSGSVNIAYQVVGDGPLDLVFVMGWVSHLEYFWREPSFARFLSRLASFSRLILFDKRGTGLSDRVPLAELPTLEQRMDDVRAVMDAVGSERAALCGVSEGGPMCSLFAATYPAKTLAIVMIGTYAKRMWDPEYPWAPRPENREAFIEEMEKNWGGAVGLEERAPTMAHDPQFRNWWATYLRMGASPGAAVALTRMNAQIDIRHVLPSIRVPTLVIHRAGDLCLKVEEGRYVARRIRGAAYVELPGDDHLPFVGDQDAILDEIEQFLSGVRRTAVPDTVLATVLFANLADRGELMSTSDDPSTDRVDRYFSSARREVSWFRGRAHNRQGDTLLATFDGPARAIRCAQAIREAARRVGIELKVGLHTGECEVTDDRVAGIAVDIASQVAAVAEPGSVLVSSTVKDLVAGSGIHFEETDSRIGSDAGEWQLYGVTEV